MSTSRLTWTSFRALGLAAWCLASAIAVPSAALSQGANPFLKPGITVNKAAITAQGYYQQLLNNPSPCTDITCGVVFSAVPAGKTLVIENVSCFFHASGTAPVTLAGLLSLDNTAFVALTPILVGTSAGGVRSFNLGTTTVQIIRSGKKPFVLVQFDTAVETSISCSISGQLKP